MRHFDDILQQITVRQKGNEIMRVLTKTYRWLRRRDVVKRDFCTAKHRLLSSMELTREEKVLLGKISLQIHSADSMYYLDNDAFHYLSVGLLLPVAFCIFSTHGQRSIDWIESKKVTHGLKENAQQEVIRGFQEQGYGYADYPNELGWGISTVSHQRIVELAKGVGSWYETLFLEHGWDNHQDVYAFAMQLPNGGLEPTP